MKPCIGGSCHAKLNNKYPIHGTFTPPVNLARACTEGLEPARFLHPCQPCNQTNANLSSSYRAVSCLGAVKILVRVPSAEQGSDGKASGRLLVDLLECY